MCVFYLLVNNLQVQIETILFFNFFFKYIHLKPLFRIFSVFLGQDLHTKFKNQDLNQEAKRTDSYLLQFISYHYMRHILITYHISYHYIDIISLHETYLELSLEEDGIELNFLT